MKRFSLKRVLILFLSLILLAALSILGCNLWVQKTASTDCYDDAQKIPSAHTALVLGCTPKISSRDNLFYLYRIQAAKALYNAGKVKAFIVSGDNGNHSYDEPTAMKESLIAEGIPANIIHCDFAGFRTLDSIVRADAIFDQKEFIVVSQRFHNERALFLAKHHGIQATALNARDVSRSFAPLTYLREYLARVKAVLDVTILQTEPKFYGPKISISEAKS